MLRLSIYSILLLAGVVQAQAIVESDIDHESFSQRSVLMVHPIQTTLYGPEISSPTGGTGMAGLSGMWKDSPAWLLPGLADIGIQISNFRNRHISAAAAVDELAMQFNFFEETDDALKLLESDKHWLMPPVYTINFSSSLSGGWVAESDARRAFRASPAGKAVFLHFVYFMSPDLLQVRVVADMKVFMKPRSESAMMHAMTRRFEFMSQPVKTECSQWKRGQRDKVLEEVERKYHDKLSAFPHNKKAYTQDYKLALKSLRDPVTMPPIMVFANCWPADSLPTALRTGILNIVAMIRADFNPPAQDALEEETRTSFEGLTLNGRHKTFRGVLIGKSGSHSVVRLKNGDVYSVPTDQSNL